MSDKMSVAEAVEWLNGKLDMLSPYHRQAGEALLARAAEPTLAELQALVDGYDAASGGTHYLALCGTMYGWAMYDTGHTMAFQGEDAEALPAIRAATAAERQKRKPQPGAFEKLEAELKQQSAEAMDLSKCGGKRCVENFEAKTCGVEKNGWICTLPPEHDGPHIACGDYRGTVKDHDIASWPNDIAPAQPVTLEDVHAKLARLAELDFEGQWRVQISGDGFRINGGYLYVNKGTLAEVAEFLDKAIAEHTPHAKPEPTPLEAFERIRAAIVGFDGASKLCQIVRAALAEGGA